MRPQYLWDIENTVEDMNSLRAIYFVLLVTLAFLPDTEGWVPFIIRKVKWKDVSDVDMPSDKILDKVLNNLETRRNYDKPAKVWKYPDNKKS